MIDQEGFRRNVGIVVINQEKRVLWARRLGNQNAWQFPQGGISEGEEPIHAMYRELKEKLGLNSDDVKVIAETAGWYEYRLPPKFQRKEKAGTRSIGHTAE